MSDEINERLAEALVDWWASELDDEAEATFIRTAPESQEAAGAYAAALRPTVDALLAEARREVVERVEVIHHAAANRDKHPWARQHEAGADPAGVGAGVCGECVVSLPDIDTYDTLRNRVACRLANAALRLASVDYRLFIRGAIEYGMRSAARDASEGREAP